VWGGGGGGGGGRGREENLVCHPPKRTGDGW